MIGCPQPKPHKVRHGESHKGHWSAECCGYTGHDAGNQKQHKSGRSGFDTHARCVIISEQHRIESFGNKDYQQKTYETHGSHNGYLKKVCFGKAPHTPIHIASQRIIGGLELECINYRRGKKGEHDTENEQCGVIRQLP